MKNINKKIFIIALICAVLAIGLIQIEVFKEVNTISGAVNSNSEKVNSFDNDGSVSDMEGYAMIGYGISNVTMGVVGFFYIMMDVAFLFGTIAYLTLYFVAWIIFVKKESKKKIKTSTILYIVAIIVQIIIIVSMIGIMNTIKSIGVNALIILSIILQIIPIISTTVIFLNNFPKYIKEYKEEKEESEIVEEK